MNEKIKALLAKSGINATRVSVIGRFVHIDSYKKYDLHLQHVMTAAGFVVLQARDGIHLDEYNGYRLSAKVAA